MTVAALPLAAALLSLERLFYVWVWNRPQQFAVWCDRARKGTPVDALERAFFFFKLLQVSVFAGWCLRQPGLTWPGSGGVASLLTGGSLLVGGQFLNYSVFRRLGRVGVFYGNRFGHLVPWCTEFPFSVLDHPQYVGALLSIWGFFLLMRFPQPDWLFLPAVETLYYAAGAYLER
jgi:phosphatidyl-N-methylethanolamine N-methyltransferase